MKRGLILSVLLILAVAMFASTLNNDATGNPVRVHQSAAARTVSTITCGIGLLECVTECNADKTKDDKKTLEAFFKCYKKATTPTQEGFCVGALEEELFENIEEHEYCIDQCIKKHCSSRRV